MSKLEDTIALYRQSRGEVLTLKKAVADGEASVERAQEAVNAAIENEQKAIEEAIAAAKLRVQQSIGDAVAQAERERAALEVSRKNLKKATTVLLQSASNITKLMGADVSGVLGTMKAEIMADHGEEATAAQ
jgi:hypothetical protein